MVQKRNERQAFWKKAYINKNKLNRLLMDKEISIEYLQFILQQYVLRL